VERFSFTSQDAFVPRGDLLDRVTVAPLTRSIVEGSPIQAAIFRFESGGRLRRHPATDPQIFAILEGSGEVSGADGDDESGERPSRVRWSAQSSRRFRSLTQASTLLHDRSVSLASVHGPRDAAIARRRSVEELQLFGRRPDTRADIAASRVTRPPALPWKPLGM
jgi:hypothetical protein